MGIKKTKNSEQEYSVRILQARLNNLLKDNYLNNLPQDIKQKLQNFHDELGNYQADNDKSQYKLICDKVLTKEEVKEIIVDASGYTCWQLEETEKLNKEEIEDLQDEFGITFKEEKIYRYRYYRSTNNRNAVNMITVTALPGYNQVDIDTDRAGISLEGLVTPKEMKTQIEEQME